MHQRLQPCVYGCQGERDWLHANSVDYTLGPDGGGYVLLSYNVPSEVVVVRWPAAGEAGEAAGVAAEGESGILFRFGNPLVARTGDRHARQLFCQHSAKWVQGSHGAGGSSLRFILFNNGCAPHRRALNIKRVAAFATQGAAAFAHPRAAQQPCAAFETAAPRPRYQAAKPRVASPPGIACGRRSTSSCWTWRAGRSSKCGALAHQSTTWLQVAPSLDGDSASSACVASLKAQGAPPHLGAQPGPPSRLGQSAAVNCGVDSASECPL